MIYTVNIINALYICFTVALYSSSNLVYCPRITRRHSGWARDGELSGMCDGLAAADAEWTLAHGRHCASTTSAPSVRDCYPRCHGYGGSRWGGTTISLNQWVCKFMPELRRKQIPCCISLHLSKKIYGCSVTSGWEVF